METTYTISVRDPAQYAETESFIQFEPIGGQKVMVRPNVVYRDQVKQKLEALLDKILKFTTLFNLQKCMQHYISFLEIEKCRTEQQYYTQLNNIDSEIQNIENDLEEAKQELDQFNKEQQSQVSFKEAIYDEVKYLMGLMDENYLQEEQERMRLQRDAMIREKTQIDNRLTKGLQNLQSAKNLKVKLETEITKTISDCNDHFSVLKDAQHDVELYILNVQAKLVDLYQDPNRWEDYIHLLNEHIKLRSDHFGQLQILQSKYFVVEQELTTYRRKFLLNAELTHVEIELEARRVEIPFIKAEIARCGNKRQEAEDLLPALRAIDSIDVISNCYTAINNNFEQVRTGEVKLIVINRVNNKGETETSYELKRPTYYFQFPNLYDVKKSEEVLAAEREIEYWSQQIIEKENRINQLDHFEREIKRLTQERATLEEKNQNELKAFYSFNNQQLQNLQFLITLSQIPISDHEFVKDTVSALLGCLSQYMCVKDDSFFMCCRCCYSKDLHNYTDIYYRDFVRVFINQYRKNNNVGMQAEITLQNVQRIRLQETLDLLLDFEYVGAYRTQEGTKQYLTDQQRTNSIEKSLIYNLFEICNLYITQEMMKLNFYANIAMEERQRYENFRQQVEMGNLAAQNNPQILTPLK